MDVIDSVFNRIRDEVPTIIHQRLRDDIASMLLPQLTRIPKIDSLSRQLLVDAIVMKFRDSMIKNNDPVGIMAALVSGENQTQSSLSSHHNAGLKRGAQGFERVLQITELKKVPYIKAITSSLLGVPRSREEMHRIAFSMIELNTRQFMSKTMPYSLLSYKSLDELFSKNPWYRTYLNIRHVKDNVLVYGTETISEAKIKTKFARIYMNSKILWRHKLTLQDIAYSLQEVSSGKYTVLYSPASIKYREDGTVDMAATEAQIFIDIHVMVDNVTDREIYAIISDVKDTYISGIKGVDTAYALQENLLTNIRVSQIKEETLESGEVERTFRVDSSAPNYIPPYAWKFLLSRMIPDIKFQGTNGRIFTALGYGQEQVKKMILECPLVYGDIAIIDQENLSLTFDDSKMNEFPYLEYADLSPRKFNTYEDMHNFLLTYMVPYHQYWYIEVMCDDIGIVFSIPEIDPMYTFTINPSDCVSHIGYLAMRSMIFQEFREIVKIANIHIKVLVNNMTMGPSPIPFERSGMKKNFTSWMTSCTFEDEKYFLSHAAFCGECDPLTSMTSAKLVGKEVPIGRGGRNLPPVENRFKSMLKKMSIGRVEKMPFSDYQILSKWISADDILLKLREMEGIFNMSRSDEPAHNLMVNDDIVKKYTDYIDWFTEDIRIREKESPDTQSMFEYFKSGRWISDYKKELILQYRPEEAFRRVMNRNIDGVYRSPLRSVQLLVSLMRLLKPKSIFDSNIRWGESIVAALLYEPYGHNVTLYGIGNNLLSDRYKQMLELASSSIVMAETDHYDFVIADNIENMRDGSFGIARGRNLPSTVGNMRKLQQILVARDNVRESWTLYWRPPTNRQEFITRCNPDLVQQLYHWGSLKLNIVREDLLIGGTYLRIAHNIIGNNKDIVYVASTISDPKAVAISYAGLNLNVKVHIMMPRSRTASKSPYLLACILFGANIILTDIQSQQRELKKISTAVNITHASVASYSNSKVMMIRNLESIYMPSIDIVKEVSPMIQTLYYVGDKRDVNAINIQSPLAVEQGIPYPCNSASDAYVASALKLSDIAQANILNISAI